MRASPLALFSLAVLCVAPFCSAPLAAQPIYSGGSEVGPLPLGARNTISNLHVENGRLYAGPGLVFTDDGQTFSFVDDPAFERAGVDRVSVFSIDAEGDVVWVGLGYTDENSEDEPQTAAGFAYSTDGGQTWTQRFAQLDSPDDTTLVYGVSSLRAIPVVVPQLSPPFDIDYDPATGDVWVAGFASGLRKSADEGRTWQRIVLPPDSSDAIDPSTPYGFVYAPLDINIQQNGFVAFSVLVDEAGTVWAGTAAGVARSDTSDIDGASGDRAWRRFAFDDTDRSLASDFVISIEEQPLGDETQPVGSAENPRNPVWITTWPAESGGDFGLTVWRGDELFGDPVFETVLLPAGRIYDVAFDGDQVYVAGIDGLYISPDGGQTWRTVTTFVDTQGRVIPLGTVGVFAVAVVEDGIEGTTLWAGSSEGLLKSRDGGQTWQAFRVNVPLSGGVPFGSSPVDPDAVPEVESYAYPNPFTPGAPGNDGFCRIRFDTEAVPEGGTARVRIFDFGMRLVRTLDAPARSGANEALWDGRTDDGTRVANGTYIYVVEAGGADVSGKILVLQ